MAGFGILLFFPYPQMPQGKHFLLKLTLTFRCAFTCPACCLCLSTDSQIPVSLSFDLTGKLAFFGLSEGISKLRICWVHGEPAYHVIYQSIEYNHCFYRRINNQTCIYPTVPNGKSGSLVHSGMQPMT